MSRKSAQRGSMSRNAAQRGSMMSRKAAQRGSMSRKAAQRGSMMSRKAAQRGGVAAQRGSAQKSSRKAWRWRRGQQGGARGQRQRQLGANSHQGAGASWLAPPPPLPFHARRRGRPVTSCRGGGARRSPGSDRWGVASPRGEHAAPAAGGHRETSICSRACLLCPQRRRPGRLPTRRLSPFTVC
jgi:hypothetical protein